MSESPPPKPVTLDYLSAPPTDNRRLKIAGMVGLFYGLALAAIFTFVRGEWLPWLPFALCIVGPVLSASITDRRTIAISFVPTFSIIAFGAFFETLVQYYGSPEVRHSHFEFAVGAALLIGMLCPTTLPAGYVVMKIKRRLGWK